MIPRVRVVPNQNQKFVLVRVHDGSDEFDLLWGNPEAEWHKDIVEEVCATGSRVLLVHGGGRIEHRPDTKALYVWDRSTRYGAADPKAIEAALTETFPDHTIHIGVMPL